MKRLIMCGLAISLALLYCVSVRAQSPVKCEVSVKGGKYEGKNIAPIRDDPNILTGFLLVRPKDINRDFLIALATRLKQEYCHAKKISVFIFDQKKYANVYSIIDFTQSNGKTILMRGAYGFDREVGTDVIEFSTKLGNPTTEVTIDLTEIVAKELPTNCEEGRRMIDNALYEIKDDPKTKIEFVLRSGSGEAKKIAEERESYVLALCDKRGFPEKCSVKRGDARQGLGAIDLLMKGDPYGAIYFRKNEPSPCPNPANWDIY